MPSYNVTRVERTYTTVTVQAEDEDDAIELAMALPQEAWDAEESETYTTDFLLDEE